jgi:lipopolysaccharide transport system ATP-binding protein
MNSPESSVIFHQVCKNYQLYQNQWQMVRGALGFKNKEQAQTFHALKNINLDIKKGERIGLVGRNGAGKSTLLKLMTGNFTQSSGQISIHGRVQALMNTGIGFHPEFNGLENIKASLVYNGLDRKQFDSAIQDVIDFVELGEFLYQPFKTYSLGMQSRLFFAVATAIQPEILIIDEVLGAGDAYFSAKSADRMKKLTNSGCTLILVSHSTQQVLQFCEKAIWLECGEIVMRGEAIDVVKAYENFTKKLELEAAAKNDTPDVNIKSVIQSKWLREKLLEEVLSNHQNPLLSERLKEQGQAQSFGISRWPSLEPGLKINNIQLLDATQQIRTNFKSNQKLTIQISVIAEHSGSYDVSFVILLFTEDGRWLTRHCSNKTRIQLKAGETHTASLKYEKILLGKGKYIFSAAIYKELDLSDLTTARYYDLLSRSFEFNIETEYQDDLTLFNHPAQWVGLDVASVNDAAVLSVEA